jgi:hypothetical protein
MQSGILHKVNLRVVEHFVLRTVEAFWGGASQKQDKYNIIH